MKMDASQVGLVHYRMHTLMLSLGKGQLRGEI
jgi:hypothetical protein